MKFIIWDPNDGIPRRDEAGVITSDGVTGRIGEDNVYLTTYARWPQSDLADVARSYRNLAVGECIKGVVYSLSGSRGTYTVYRVE